MIQVFINDEEVVSDSVISITEEMLATSSTILTNCYPKSWEEDRDYINRFYFPQDYSLCKILKDNETIFVGCVKNTGKISLNPREAKYCELQILDFKTFLSEGETLDFVISDKTVMQAIEMVINAINDYGVVLGNINILNGDSIIGAYSTLNKTPYDVFQYLADITQSKWTTRTLNDNSIAVDFYDPTLMPNGKNIDYTNEWFNENLINDLSFSYSTNDYRNKQIMLSDAVYADIDYNESIVADGYSKTFTTSNSIAVVKNIKVDGVEYSFATKNEKELGIEANFYYEYGKNEFEQDEALETLIGGTQIIITYTPLVQGRQIVYNYNEVDRITNQLQRKGVVARYENRNDILSSEELRKVGQSYIKYKGLPEITLTVQSEKDLWNIGQVTLFNAPIEELATDYMVKKKTTKILTNANKIFYTYELSSNFNSENAINYFDNQRNKASGNISIGEAITRNIDIENQANIIFKNLSIVEKKIQGDNILNSILNSPFNN